jgi:GNAT superfamily N-acetyltransferase
MFVHAEFRGAPWGVAQRLLETLKEHCLANDITHLYLGTIDVMKAAHRFYERNGFVVLPKEELPSSFPVMTVDNRFYHLNLGALPG